MRVLVVTVVHDPRDARIHSRQIDALLAAGVDVVFAAPFADRGVAPPDGVEAVDLPRAAGRRRSAALRAARRLLARRRDVDLVLLHDPELVLATLANRIAAPVVWDVHEDTRAALLDRDWMPGPLVPLVGAVVGAVERAAEHRCHLLLAEHGYAARFAGHHPVVPNVPVVPATPRAPAGGRRVVYLGRVAASRGAYELIELARSGVAEVAVLGWAEPDVAPALAAAPNLTWSGGFVPNAVALDQVEGALAGLSLLHDLPNYRVSMPTKVLEYAARGVPVITTPLPEAVRVVEQAGCGVVVPFADATAVADAVRDLREDPERAAALGAAGHRWVRDHANWAVEGPRFVATLSRWASP